MDATAKAARLVTLRESWARCRPRTSREERAGMREAIRRETIRADRFFQALAGRDDPGAALEIAGEELREFDASELDPVDALPAAERMAA